MIKATAPILLRDGPGLARDGNHAAQQPRLAPHVPAMQAAIAACLAVEPAAVNVKAKTHERLGFEGRSEGIVAQAVVLLQAAP